MTASIHIFGLNHFLQNETAGWLTAAGLADVNAQKAQLYDCLRGIIGTHAIRTVAEEAKPDEWSMGRRIATDFSLSFIDITMPLAERAKFGTETPDYDRTTASREAAYRVFERFMFETIIPQTQSTLV